MVPARELGEPEAAHHRLRRLVEHSRHRVHLGHPHAAERDVERRARRLGGVALVPGGAGQSPADLHPAGARHVVGHRVEPGEADELAGPRDLQRPQPESLGLEPFLKPVDPGVARRPVQRGGEEPHGVRVGVELRERLSVAVLPAAHHQPVGPQAVESGGRARFFSGHSTHRQNGWPAGSRNTRKVVPGWYSCLVAPSSSTAASAVSRSSTITSRCICCGSAWLGQLGGVYPSTC